MTAMCVCVCVWDQDLFDQMSEMLAAVGFEVWNVFLYYGRFFPVFFC